MQRFEKIPLSERVGKVGYLIKHTFTVVGRDSDIVNPIARMALYGIVQSSAFLLGAMALLYAMVGEGEAEGLWLWGWTGVLGGLALLVYKFFYFNRQEFRLSYLVHQTVTGEDKSYGDAAGGTRELKSSMRGMALIDMLMAYVNKTSSNGEKKGLSGMLISLVLAGLNEVWDLVNHFMIPAIVVDRVRLRDCVEHMKELQRQVPETLVGVFGIDLFGRIVVTLMAPIYLVMLLLALWLSIALAGALPSITVPTQGTELPAWMLTDGALVITLIPLFALVLLTKILSVVLERAVTAIKVMYFTIFYLQIKHPESIAPELRDELTAYVRMEDDSAAVAAGEPA
ncbi:hypothetical protein [Algiphilus sp.]|uniref:hypothetical protein n=1 Tax=Algiphilus sp. TaxID=1872431 RepID=UPI0025C3CBC8|nr:hypothetical protein [Algiphilus sp.]MCK5771232.1 hypothetical protein [Algiphilus sp.]